MYWPSKNMREVIKELQVSGGQWFEGGGGEGQQTGRRRCRCVRVLSHQTSAGGVSVGHSYTSIGWEGRDDPGSACRCGCERVQGRITLFQIGTPVE